jgi:dephospho-CoA kinase
LKTSVIEHFSDESTQIERLMQRNELSKEEAVQRIESQMPLSEKCKRATVLVDNSGSKEETRVQVLNIYDELKSSYAFLRLRIPVILCGTLLALVILKWIGVL